MDTMLGDTLSLRRQQGFTLIELVIVIVIIGILAAIALPKFVSLSGDARAGTIKGVSGSLAAANTAIYAAASIQNKGGTGQTGISACGVNTIAGEYGYAKDLTELLKCVTLTPAGDFTIAAPDVRHAGASDPPTCQVAYGAATATNGPSYTVVTNGC
jgi:MSHA pilin protein MshA